MTHWRAFAERQNPMHTAGRHPWILTLVAALLLAAPCTQSYANVPRMATPEVLNLRVGLTPGRTRVVFDLSMPADYKLVTLENPNRVAVDFPATTNKFDPGRLALRDTHIASVHTEGSAVESLRYVFDVPAGVEPKAFTLKPFQQNGHRLVLDLYVTGDTTSNRTADTVAAPPIQVASNSRGDHQPPQITPQSATQIDNPVSSGASGEWSGSLSLESRLFAHDPAWPKQDEQNISVAFEPEYYLDWANGRQRFAFSPFFRYDANDDERTHADIRELYWRLEHQQWVLKAGVDVVFWGVTESQHLVDVINQTDWVENIDGEDKLGQPMLNVDYMTDSMGTWQAYVLPYFRERTFPGERGRLRTEPTVDTNDPLYESNDEEQHIDLALRWSHYIGDWDMGVAHFSGTSRDPVLLPTVKNVQVRLVPLYLQIEQTSLDVQATKDAWLWKLEALHNDNSLEDFFATVGGFEFTHYGLSDTPADLGWLLEYHYDERDERALSMLQNDVFAGVRLTGNDVAGTRVLAGVTIDLDSGSTFGNMEAVRRLGESWTMTMEARLFTNVDKKDPLYPIREDDYLELQLSRYF